MYMCTCVHIMYMCCRWISSFHCLYINTHHQVFRLHTLFPSAVFSHKSRNTKIFCSQQLQELFQGKNQTHHLKLIDIFIIHHFEMILASAWPNSFHLSNGNRGSSGLASARELKQKGPILSPSKYIMNGLATEKKEYSSLSQERK